MELKNVLLVDDHAVTRLGLKELLVQFCPLLKIYESDNGDSMLLQLKSTRIDIIVLDIQMDNSNTLNLVELISIKYPKTSILIFSMLPEAVYGRRMLKAGAKGFLSKTATVKEIRWAFEMMLSSKRYVSSVLADLLSENALDNKHSEPFRSLSHREFEIMQDLLAGHSLSSIGQRLNLKPSTVGTYKSRIFEKLKVSNIFQLKEMAVLYS
jgi:two-component system, NarL family, invasion response regulator UvrY